MYEIYFIEHGRQHPIPLQYEVEKVFPERGSLCLYQLAKGIGFTCTRCGLEKKLVPRNDSIPRNDSYLFILTPFKLSYV